MADVEPVPSERALGRWARRLTQAILVLLTLALMAAILLPVFRGVSNDGSQRNAVDERPHRLSPRP